LYTSSNIKVIKSKRLRWEENVERMGEMSNAYNILIGKAERKRSVGNPRCR
jgi:hypothetical protein